VEEGDLSRLDVTLVVVAIACGATVLSHVNDSGFWLVGRFLGMDVKTTLRTWTVMETLIGVVGFAIAWLLSLLVQQLSHPGLLRAGTRRSPGAQ
jgi:gluconate:H+ symporter, GntP family